MNWFKTNWKSVLLVLSLSLNVLIFAGMATHALRDGHRPRIQATAWSQLLPRDFFVDLPETRRKQLLGSLRDYSGVFRDGRAGLRQNAAQVADALEADPFDPEKLDQALREFSKRGGDLISEGSQAAQDIFNSLSPDERKQLAKSIRKRTF